MESAGRSRKKWAARWLGVVHSREFQAAWRLLASESSDPRITGQTLAGYIAEKQVLLGDLRLWKAQIENFGRLQRQPIPVPRGFGTETGLRSRYEAIRTLVYGLHEIGRASGRRRVGTDGSVSVVAGAV